MLKIFKNKSEDLPKFWQDYEAKFQEKLPTEITETRFVVFDTETTGFDLKKDRMLSIGAVAINKKSIDQLDEESFRANLLLPEMPDPDLLIRTAGEKRVSNFLLYQLSYTELMFVDTLWPDFDEKELDSAVEEFQNRVRKYGNA
mgnify:CR=1 FL=1